MTEAGADTAARVGPPGGPVDPSGGGGPGAQMPTMGVPIRPAAPEEAITIGVAVAVPEPFGSELQARRASFGDPMAEAIPAHVTLLPPTAVAPGTAEDVLEHLRAVAAATAPFTVLLRGTGSFRPVSPVVFVCVYQGAAGCDALQQRIRTGPLDRELSFPYHPHVTVAHQLDDAALDRAAATLRGYRAEFTVDALGFYEHGADGVWRLRHQLAFGAGGPATAPPPGGRP